MPLPTTSVPFATPSTVARVSELVTQVLTKEAGPRRLDPSESLTDAGVSSLDMVNLMLALESAFELFIPAELIKPSSFRSINSVAAMVDSLRPANATVAA